MKPPSIPSAMLRSSAQKSKHLSSNNMNEAYRLISGCTSKLREQTNIVEAAKKNLMGSGGIHDLSPPNKLIEPTIASFNILKREDKELPFPSPVQGIINIDLLSNPILKEKYGSVPSVSRILNDTMPLASKTALDKWKMRMTALMGETNFQEFYQAQLNQGKDFHESVKGRLMSKAELEEKYKNNLCLRSIEWILKDVTEVAAVESFVLHPALGYKGILDCVAKYKEKPVLIEWKHSSKKRSRVSSTYDAPLQMTAYMGALSEDKNYNFQVDSGLVVVAHSDGSPADLFEVNSEECQKYWTQWLQRLGHFTALQRISPLPPTI